MQYEMWCAFTDSANNARNAIEYLTHCVDWQFPQIKKDRNVFAFRNGIYVTKQDEFFPYPVSEDQLDPSVVACNFIDVPFQNYTSEDCDGDWYKIPTPNFQKILDYQNLSAEVSRWMYICMGRLLYRVNENDGWQIIPFIKGAAGSGKSTICKVAKDFYDVEDVGILSNNIERTFGLSQVFDKFLFIAPEIKRDFNLDQAEFQSMVSGEDLAIAIKNKKAQTCLWETPGILAGNEVPEWVDNSGSISRRVLTFHFPLKVTQSDPDLSKKLQRELPALIKKCNVAYGSAVEEFGSNNIWTVLPKYFLEKQREMAESCNALQAFLSSDLVVKDRAHYVPKDQFVKAMQEFCVANSYPRPRFEKDFYSAIFDQHKLELRSDQLPYPKPNGEMRTRQFIIGVDLAVNLH
jgi:phage/plasmid-associated DNA primase